MEIQNHLNVNETAAWEFKKNNQLSQYFQQILLKYEKIVEGYLSDHCFEKVLKNKSLALLFLDKVQHQNDPDADQIQNYGYSSTSIASLDILSYLKKAMDQDVLDLETKKMLKNWMNQEKKYLPLALILDGIRASNRDLMKALQKKDADIFDQQKFEFTIPLDDLKIVVKMIIHQLQELPIGEFYKVLGGHSTHETRFLFKKVNAQVFEVTHLNTGEVSPFSMITGRYACAEMTSKTLYSVNFWLEFLTAKLREEDILWVEHFEVLHHFQPLSQSKGLKSTQDFASCAYQSVMADLKYYLVSQRPDGSESLGILQYKILKGLMVEQALKETQSDPHYDPCLIQMLKRKYDGKTRYLELQRQQDRLTELQKQLMQLFQELTPKHSGLGGLLLRGLKNSLPMERFLQLEKELENLLDSSPARIMHYQKLIEEDSRFAGLKSIKKWILPKFFQITSNNEMILRRKLLEKKSLKGQLRELLHFPWLKCLNTRNQTKDPLIECYLDYLTAEADVEKAFELGKKLIEARLIKWKTLIKNFWRIRFPLELSKKFIRHLEEHQILQDEDQKEMLANFKEALVKKEEHQYSHVAFIHFSKYFQSWIKK